MSEKDYDRALASAKQELEELLAGQRLTEKRITTLKQLIANLMTLREQEVPADLIGPGLTGACRNVLCASVTGMTPLEVRNALRSIGFDVGRYNNVLASIHSVLKRLVEAAEAETMTREGKTIYRWNLRFPPPPSLPDGPPPPSQLASKR